MTSTAKTPATKTATATPRKRAPRKTSLTLAPLESVLGVEGPKPTEEIIEVDLSKIVPAEGRDLVSELTATVLAPAAKKAPAKRAPRKPAAKATAPKIELTPKAAEAVEKVEALRESVAQASKIISEVSDQAKTAQEPKITVEDAPAKVVPIKAMPAKPSKPAKVKVERVAPVSPYKGERFATLSDQGATVRFDVIRSSPTSVTLKVVDAVNPAREAHKAGQVWLLRLRADSTFRGSTSTPAIFSEDEAIEGWLEENPQEAQEAAPESLSIGELLEGLTIEESAPEAAAE